MQTPDPNAVTASAMALTAAAVAVSADWSLLGIPPAVWFACFSGAMFGATWFEPRKQVSKPWAILINFAAGVVLSAGIAEYLKLSVWSHATTGFVAAAWPVLLAERIRNLIVGAISGALGPK